MPPCCYARRAAGAFELSIVARQPEHAYQVTAGRFANDANPVGIDLSIPALAFSQRTAALQSWNLRWPGRLMDARR